MSRFHSVLLGALVLALAGCGGEQTAPITYSFAGHWTGTYTDPGGGTLGLDLTLADNMGTVSGNGTLAISGSPPFACAVSVTGTRTDQTFRLAIHCTGFRDLSFAGAFASPTAATGRLEGSGYAGESLTLSRQ